jgi:hypothetical protein
MSQRSKEGIAQWQKAIMTLQTDCTTAVDARSKSLEDVRTLSNLGLTKYLAQFDNNSGIVGDSPGPPLVRGALWISSRYLKFFHPVDPERPKALQAKLYENKAAAAK